MTNGSVHISTWVTTEPKQRFNAMAQQLGLSESALLKRMLDLTLQGTRVGEAPFLPSPTKVSARRADGDAAAGYVALEIVRFADARW